MTEPLCCSMLLLLQVTELPAAEAGFMVRSLLNVVTLTSLQVNWHKDIFRVAELPKQNIRILLSIGSATNMRVICWHNQAIDRGLSLWAVKPMSILSRFGQVLKDQQSINLQQSGPYRVRRRQIKMQWALEAINNPSRLDFGDKWFGLAGRSS